jgi:hypothetical protein
MPSIVTTVKRTRFALFIAAALLTLVVAQDCGQPECPEGQAPCNAGVDSSGAVCWSCCPA